MKLIGSDLTDDVLLMQIKQGSRQAFESLHERYWGKAYATAYKRLKDHAQSEDIVQDIFVHLWLKRQELTIKNLSAYLDVSIRNQVLKVVAKQSRFSPFLDILQEIPEKYSEADSGVRWKEFYTAYESILKSLPEKRQIIFRLRFQDDLSTKVIANKLGLSVKTVQNQLGKAIEQLRISLLHLLAILVVLLSGN